MRLRSVATPRRWWWWQTGRLIFGRGQLPCRPATIAPGATTQGAGAGAVMAMAAAKFYKFGGGVAVSCARGGFNI